MLSWIVTVFIGWNSFKKNVGKIFWAFSLNGNKSEVCRLESLNFALAYSTSIFLPLKDSLVT